MLKAQTEAVSMTLFFLIAVIMLFSVFFWGNSTIGGSSEEANLFSSEQFVQSLDSKIQDVAKNGGVETIPMRPSATILLVQGSIIEYSFQSNANVPEDWFYVYGDSAAEVGVSEPSSVVREKKENGRIKIQLYYRNRTGASKFAISPFIFYEGAGRNMVRIENNGTSTSGNFIQTRIRLTV